MVSRENNFMNGIRDAVLIVDEDWGAADRNRQAIKGVGIINVPIATTESLVSLAKDYFLVTYICVSRSIKQNPAHPLWKAIIHHFPSTPVVSYGQSEVINPELFRPGAWQRLDKHSGIKKDK